MTLILGIETSCDDTSIAIVKDGKTILSNIISSQINAHRPFGGIVPELASRKHCEIINKLLDIALKEASVKLEDISGIAVTTGPGLEGALLVGASVAKTLHLLTNIPLIPINHMHGHIYAHFLSETPPSFPFIALIASGGHTQLIKVNKHLSFELLGQTRDDAAGEAFDKTARSLGLGYPGGPIIEKTAKEGNIKAFKFPIGLKHSPLEFSFSGLKTAVIQTLKSLEKPYPIPDLCASFQNTVIETLLQKALYACKSENISTLVLAGGVMANRALTHSFKNRCEKETITLHALPPVLCTDNAAMIAAVGYYRLTLSETPKWNSVCSNMAITE
jgi:N6-L-threonylcarbamoyladenine synthase